MKKTIFLIFFLALGTGMVLQAQNTTTIGSASQTMRGNVGDNTMMGAGTHHSGGVPYQMWVTITGKLEPLAQREYYQLTDSTGQLTAKIDRDVWRGLTLKSGETVTIFGKISWEHNNLVLYAKHIQSGEARGPVITTAADALKMSDDDWVVMRGQISQGTRHEQYTFTDASGQITLEIDNSKIRDLMLKPGDTVTIYGEVDKEKRSSSPKIDVEYIEKVQ